MIYCVRSEVTDVSHGPGRFVTTDKVEREQLPFGALAWLCRPGTTGAKSLVVIDVELLPGQGHNFHQHPDQEEVLYVISGRVEQWLEHASKTLCPGDAIFINPGVVHASFNTTNEPVRFLAILGPAVTDAGYVSVEVGDQEPWRSMRT